MTTYGIAQKNIADYMTGWNDAAMGRDLAKNATTAYYAGVLDALRDRRDEERGGSHG